MNKVNSKWLINIAIYIFTITIFIIFNKIGQHLYITGNNQGEKVIIIISKIMTILSYLFIGVMIELRKIITLIRSSSKLQFHIIKTTIMIAVLIIIIIAVNESLYTYPCYVMIAGCVMNGFYITE